MRDLKLFLALIILQSSVAVHAQENEALCTKGLSYGELVSLFQIYNVEKLKNTLSQKCFEQYINDDLLDRVGYERKYEKTADGTTTSYNELFEIKYGKAYEYSCSEFEVCLKLLKQINDNAIYYARTQTDTNAYIYILKDKVHVLEMRDIPDPNIGWSYGFKYRDIRPTDLNEWRDAKLKDEFPKTNVERARLEYRYERVDSYNNLTTIHLNAGDKVFIEAGGEIVLGPFAGSTDIGGIEGYANYKRVPDFKHGSLLFRVGEGAWNAVKDEMTYTATNTGNMQFLVNDSDPSNNSGQFWVGLKIIKAAGSGAVNK